MNRANVKKSSPLCVLYIGNPIDSIWNNGFQQCNVGSFEHGKNTATNLAKNGGKTDGKYPSHSKSDWKHFWTHYLTSTHASCIWIGKHILQNLKRPGRGRNRSPYIKSTPKVVENLPNWIGKYLYHGCRRSLVDSMLLTYKTKDETLGQTSKLNMKKYFFGDFLSADFWQKLSE